nr:MAG TPA_asm: hypothetical protein [Caudoviricetes sp.]
MVGAWVVKEMGLNEKIEATVFTDETEIQKASPLKVKAVHVEELRTAIKALQGYAQNVDNCGNCIYCQSCEGCQTCEGCQSKACQSTSCQGCQKYSVYCQVQCKSGNSGNCWQCSWTKPNCDCNCSDDGG